MNEKELLEKVNQEATLAIQKFTAEYKEIATKAAEGKMDKKAVDDALAGLETKSQEFTNLQLKAVNEELLKVKQEIIDARADLKAMKETAIVEKSEKFGFGTLLRKSLEKENLIQETVIDPLSGKKAISVKGWDRNDLKLQTKVAIDMTTALTQLPGATPGTSVGYLTDYSKMRDVLVPTTKDQHAVTFLPTDPITGEYMGVLVEHTYFDGAAVVVEGQSPVASSIKFKTIEFKVFDYAAKIRVHKNMLKDMPRLESKLNRIVPDSLLSALDAAIFSTTGDNSATAWGMYYAGNYVAFSATGLGTVSGADLVDLIGKLVLQANNADEDVNAVILHPSRLNGLRHDKNDLRDSITNRNIVFDNNGNVSSIWGLKVITNKKQLTTRVTVMLDMAAEIGLLEDVSMEIGTDADDFSKGFRTIIFTLRAAFGVGKPGAVFLSSDPDTDITAITA